MDDSFFFVERTLLQAREARAESALLRKQCEQNRALAAQTLQRFRRALADVRGFSTECPAASIPSDALAGR